MKHHCPDESTCGLLREMFAILDDLVQRKLIKKPKGDHYATKDRILETLDRLRDFTEHKKDKSENEGLITQLAEALASMLMMHDIKSRSGHADRNHLYATTARDALKKVNEDMGTTFYSGRAEPKPWNGRYNKNRRKSERYRQ